MVRDPGRARLLQRRGSRTRRQHVLGESRPAHVGRSSDPGSRPRTQLPRDHAPAARSLTRRCRLDRLPLLLHVVRHRADSRRPGLFDDRGGDLQPGRPHLRPARCRDPLPRPADLRRSDGLDHAEARSRRRRGHRPALGTRRVAETPHPPGEGSRRRKHESARGVSRRTARGARGALRCHRRRIQPRRVPRARPSHLGAPRHAVGGGLELAPVRQPLRRSSRSSSAVSPPSRSRPGQGHARSTSCSCSRSAPRP